MVMLIGTLQGIYGTGRIIIGTLYIWLGYRYEIIQLFIFYINIILMKTTPLMVW